jgi:isoleucyl-tRNA synthetase
MLEEVDRVKWFPESGHKRFRGMIEGRPDWCISRQRPWGVGIPVFYGAESGEPVLDAVAIEAVARLIEQKGSDAWYSATPDEILPSGYKHPTTGETEFRKEVDVFDVWFDSGSTWACVLEGNVEPRWKETIPCDLYLEGSDQHRGWFNLSMIIGTALTGGAPYNQVLTHGFVSAPDGQKMSKRLGNVIDPVQVCETYGADVLRLWVASVDTTVDTACSDEILKAAGEHYRRIRNTLRFLLANLYDYEGYDGEMLEIDQWAIAKSNSLYMNCLGAYERYEFSRVFREIHEFCDHTMSAFYLDAIKDRMYCDGRNWPTRLSGQRACHQILITLTRLVAPILIHTAEEVYERTPIIHRRLSVHMELAELGQDPQQCHELDLPVKLLLLHRSNVATAIEDWKAKTGIKDTQDVEVVLYDTAENLEILGQLGPDLANYFRVASIELHAVAAGASEPPSFRTSELPKCERSRVRRADVETVSWNGSTVPLSARDRRALGIG